MSSRSWRTCYRDFGVALDCFGDWIIGLYNFIDQVLLFQEFVSRSNCLDLRLRSFLQHSLVGIVVPLGLVMLMHSCERIFFFLNHHSGLYGLSCSSEFLREDFEDATFNRALY